MSDNKIYIGNNSGDYAFLGNVQIFPKDAIIPVLPGITCGTLVGYTWLYDGPIVQTIWYIGANTGLTSMYFSAGSFPDRCLLYFDSYLQIDTGYRGELKYAYGQSFRPQFNVWMNGVVDPITQLTYPNTSIPDTAPDGYPNVNPDPVTRTFQKNTSTQNCKTIIYLVAEGSSANVRVDCPPGGPPPTLTPTPTPTLTPTPTPTPLPFPSGAILYYDPGNISSYPGSGSILYDISGNGRNATINGSITWTGGTGSYFNLPGTDQVSITGATLSQTYTSWSIFAGVYINSYGSYDELVFSRRGAENTNGSGTFSTTGKLDILVNNGTEIVTTQVIPTGKWAFVNGAVDNTTYVSNLTVSGSSTFTSGSKSAGSSIFDYPIILGEDAEAGQDRTLNGRIGPVVMWNRKLSNSEITQVNDYFKSRYGI